MVDIEGGGFNIDSAVRRLEKKGVSDVTVTNHEELSVYTIQFKMDVVGEGEILGSVAEVGENGRLEMAVLRMPTYIDESREKIEDVKDVLVSAIEEVIELDYSHAVIQDRSIEINMKGDYNSGRLTPHIEFLRMADGGAPIDLDELVEIVGEVSEAWKSDLFYLDVADSR